MPENLIERYLTDLGEIRATHAHVAETSFYPALERLLSDIGKTLSPKVRCVIHPANRGAGLPDGGLFSAEQFRRRTREADSGDDVFPGQLPARGAIEAKPPSVDIRQLASSEQVGRYWERYGTVLVTNFRAFAMVGKDATGRPHILESFSLADSEAEFWRLTAHPRQASAALGDRLVEYLKRVMLHNAPLAAPQDVAEILASYAHDARLRMEQAEFPAVAGLRQALEEALGLLFEGEKGEHFFRSTLVQTLFYGLFSAWVFWARRREAKASPKKSFRVDLESASSPYALSGEFEWRSAHWLLRVPMLRALFVQIADPARLGALGLTEVLDWAASALNRVDRKAFFESFDEGHAVQYFYEPFLQAFDSELRKDLGVWYTPEEIVRYQVERVDSVLRSELGLADGLADPNVVVLDPCCGTGAYLRAVLRRIAVTLRDKGGDALVAHDLKKAAMERVFGFEILPAPFVISHLQLGLELESLGAPLTDRGDPPERVGVYLTNALTGWEPPKEAQKKIAFPGFDEERDAAGRVKQEKPILVILGNPPYNAFAGVSPEEEQGLVEPYKKGLVSEWGIKKFNLDDLYVRFFRLAEKRIAERGGRGVVSFISNHSWVSDPSFVVLRRHLLDSFDRFWIENMHGNRKISEYAPDGRTSETIFATTGFSVGIQQGVAISLWVKHSKRKGEPIVRFRDDLTQAKAADRREQLLASLAIKNFNAKYEKVEPDKSNKYAFRPVKVSSQYAAWPNLEDLSNIPPTLGILDNRQEALICIGKERLLERINKYLDPNVKWEDLEAVIPELLRDYARFNAHEARAKLLRMEPFKVENVRRVLVRPMDSRWCYYTSVRPIWTETRPGYVAQCWPGNVSLVSRRMGHADPEGTPFFFSSILGMQHSLSTDAYYLPLRIMYGKTASELTNPEETERALFGVEKGDESHLPNLSPAVLDYFGTLGISNSRKNRSLAELFWYHVLAIGYSPEYLSENSDGIRQDWPRIPLPKKKETLLVSAALGRQVAALLDTEYPVPGVTNGKIREDLKTIAVFERLDGKSAKPERGDLDLTAGWGHGGKGGVTMPGRGKTMVREDGALDVYLNDAGCWRNVPEAVWEYTIGGYQVIKKWLSYREKPLLGRGLTPDEVRYVTEMARRIAALVSMRKDLDDNYRSVIKSTYAWPKKYATKGL
ncbi:MAG: N-6 DNA methylase [Acidobacteriota bacterium]|nr:N-6 DNA methylase [Acidobacteriota bacterium]